MNCHKLTVKMSVATLTGFRCDACNVQTVTYDGSVPTACLGCGADASHLKQLWKDVVKNRTEVETLPEK